MIELDLKDYCHNCDGFEPVFVEGSSVYNDSGMISRETSYVRCRYAKRCANIEKYLTRAMAHKEGDSPCHE